LLLLNKLIGNFIEKGLLVLFYSFDFFFFWFTVGLLC